MRSAHTARTFGKIGARQAILAAVGTLALANFAAAQQLYLDNNGTTAGLGSGTATWNASSVIWSTGTAGTNPGTWTAGATANFNAGFTALVDDAESVGGISFNSGATTLATTSTAGAQLNFGSNPFTIATTSGIGGNKQIILAPIVGSGDMTVNMATTGPLDFGGNLSQFTGNITVNNTAANPATTTLDFQINNNLGDGSKTIYVDQNTRIDQNNPVKFNNVIVTPTSYSINSNVVLNYKSVANANNFVSASNGIDSVSTFGQATFVAGTQSILTFAGVISSPAGVNTNVYLGLNNGGRGTLVLANHNTWVGNTTMTMAQNNGLLQMGIDNALPTATVLTFGNGSAQVAPMDLNGHNLTIAGLATGTTFNSSNGGGGANNGNIYNTSLTGSPASPATITISGSANTTFKGDIGCTNLNVNPFNNMAPYVTGSTAGGNAQQIVRADPNISLVVNGPGTLTLAPVSNQTLGNEYTGTTTVNGGTLQFGRTDVFTAGNPPAQAYTITGSGNVVVNSGAALSSLPTTFGGTGNNYVGGAAGTIVLNSGASFTPGGAGTTGVLSTSAINFNSGSSISFDLTSASNFDQIYAGNGLTLDSTSATHTINLALTSGGTLAPGNYMLINGSINGDAPNAGAFVLNTSSISTTYQFKLADTGSGLQLQVLAPALRWDPSGTGASNPPVQENGGTWTDGSTFVNLGSSPMTEASWSNTAYPSSDVIIGGDAAQAGGVITLGEDIKVGGKLTFGPIFPGYNYNITGGGHTLTLNGGISVSNLAATLNPDGSLATPSAQIDAPVALSANQTWSVDPSQYLVVNGTVTGNFALTKAGSGTLVLNGAGGTIGSLIAGGGVVALGSLSAIGNAPITLDGGGVIFNNLDGSFPNALTIGPNGGQVGTTTGHSVTMAANITTPNAFGVVGTGTVVLAGTNSISTLDLFGGGTLQVSSAANLGNPAVIDAGSNIFNTTTLSSSVPLTLSGVIQGGGSIGLAGPEFTLAGANTIAQPGGPGTGGGSINLESAHMTVHVTNASGLGHGTTVVSADSVTVDVQTDVTSGAIRNNSTANTVHKTGPGAWILDGAATVNSAAGGVLSIDQGDVQMNRVETIGGTNVTSTPGMGITVNTGGRLLLNWASTGSRYSDNIILNGGSIERVNNTVSGDYQLSVFNTDDATLLFTPAPKITVTADSTIKNLETAQPDSLTVSRDILLEMPVVINSGATLTAQTVGGSENLDHGSIIFRGVSNNSTYPYQSVTLQSGATLKTAGNGEIALGGSGRGIPIIANGTPGSDSRLLLTAPNTFIRDAGNSLQNKNGTDMTRLVINGSGNAGLRVEAPMNASYAKLSDNTTDACTTGLFGTNTVGAPNGNGFTVLSPNRAAALSNSYTLSDGTTVINPQGTLTLAATDPAGATGVVNVGPSASVPLALALDNISTSGNLVYQFDGKATNGARLLNFASGVTVERSNPSAGTVTGQLASSTHLASLTILNDAKFDLVDHTLAVESAGSISSYLTSGALYSSRVAADTQGITTISQLLGSDLGGMTSFAGISGINPTTTLLTPAYYGDANLDGKVNADDYALVDRAFAKSLPANWLDGDFNHNGSLDSGDYLLMDKAFFLSGGGTLSPAFLAQRQSQFGPAYVAALTAAVPEPSTLALLATALPLLSRRRRSR